MGAKPVLEPRGRGSLRDDAGDKAGRVHHRCGWRPDKVGRDVAEHANIGLEASWIAGKILIWRKLCGVDEDGDHDALRPPTGGAHQREMTAVERAHGRHQRDALAGATPATAGTPPCGPPPPTSHALRPPVAP